MTMLFNGDPGSTPVGAWTGQANWGDPPWFDTWTGPRGTVNNTGTNPVAQGNDRIWCKNDAGSRFSGQKYWYFLTKPGDQEVPSSGEKSRLRRPFYNNPEWPFELDDKLRRAPTGPWGQVRYFGTSFKLDPGTLTPPTWCNFFEFKQSQSVSNGLMLAINQGSVIAGGDSQVRLFLTMTAGPFTTAGAAPGYNYNFDKPPLVASLTKDVWYDAIIGWKCEGGGPAGFANTGWASVWLKRDFETTWVRYDPFVNVPTAPYYQPNGEHTGGWISFGVYRGACNFNTGISLIGPYVATTFDDIATGIYAAGSSPPPPPVSTTLPDPVAGRSRVGVTNYTELIARANDAKIVQKRTVAPGITIEVREAYAYFVGPASGNQNQKLVVYAGDGAGAPGALAGSGVEVNVAQAAAGAWYNISPASPISVTADANGDFFYGVISGGSGTATLGTVTLLNGLWVSTDTYSDGASNPFGAYTLAAVEKTIVADYLVTADTTPPVRTSIEAIHQSVTILFNELLDIPSLPATSAFVVKVNTVAQTISTVDITGALVTLTVPALALKTGDTVTVSYTAPGSGKLRDLSLNNVANFTDISATVFPNYPGAPVRDAPSGPRPTGTRPSSGRPSGPRPEGTITS